MNISWFTLYVKNAFLVLLRVQCLSMDLTWLCVVEATIADLQKASVPTASARGTSTAAVTATRDGRASHPWHSLESVPPLLSWARGTLPLWSVLTWLTTPERKSIFWKLFQSLNQAWLITGGVSKRFQNVPKINATYFLSTAELWTTEGKFRRVADMPGAKYDHCMVAIDHNKAVAIGISFSTNAICFLLLLKNMQRWGKRC